MADSPVTAKSSSAEINTELAARRTGMSFQRTRMSAENTLMAVIRTSLSLIGFGFTIFQFFARLKQSNVLATTSLAPRRFGLSLVLLGAILLVFGIWYHVRFMVELRTQRQRMATDGLIHGESGYPISLTLIIAILLFVIGFLAAVSMIFNIGPFE